MNRLLISSIAVIVLVILTASAYSQPIDESSTEASGKRSEAQKDVVNNAQLGWIQNGLNIFYNAGKVGIGITNPVSSLHVNTPDLLDGTRIDGNIPRVRFKDTFAVPNSSIITEGDILLSDLGFNIRTFSNSPIRFSTDLEERMRITGQGNVGIGTTVPQAKLHVSNGSILIKNNDNFTPSILGIYGGNGGANIFYDPQSSIFGIKTSANNMIFDADGNIGISTTSPDQKLVVSSNSGTSIVTDTTNENLYTEYLTRSNGKNKWSVGSLSDKNAFSGNMFYIWQYTDKNDQIIGKYRLVVNDNGNVGIGTINPQAALDVDGAIKTSQGIKFMDNTVQTSAAKKIIHGVVNEDGSVSTGSGYSSVRTGNGQYTITFSSALSSTTTATATALTGSNQNPVVAQIESVSLTELKVKIYRIELPSGFVQADSLFSFIAVEQ